MPIGINDDKLPYVDCEHDLAYASTKTTDGYVLFAFDNDWQTENRDFDPKLLIYFSSPKEVDWLIEGLKIAKKKFSKTKKHYPESDDNIPNGK